MANLIVPLLILICMAYLYFKSTFVKSFAMVIIALCASTIAFAYFELLANFLISKGKFIPWAHSICFLLLFILSFIILQSICDSATRKAVGLGRFVEPIGKIVCGLFLGLIISGMLIIFLIMTPLNIKTYQRFDLANPDVENPQKALLNADGFTAGWFSLLSKGSFSGKKSFAVLHADYLDQLFLNRIGIDDKISVLAAPDAIKVPAKAAAWLASQNTKDQNGNNIAKKGKHNLTIVRIGITKKEVSKGGRFTLSQLRLICKPKDETGNTLAGTGKAVYPIGYLEAADQLQRKALNAKMQVKYDDLQGKERWIDFAFYVPNDFVPVLAEYKQNSIAKIGSMIATENAPVTIPFGLGVCPSNN